MAKSKRKQRLRRRRDSKRENIGAESISGSIIHEAESNNLLPITTGLRDKRLDKAQRQALASLIGQTAGNRILQRKLIGEGIWQRNGPTAQRWDSPEHMALGDITGVTIDIGDGVQLTFGQVLALAGDEFGTQEALLNATKTEEGRAMIRAHLERARIPGTAASLLPAPSEEQEEKAKGEYITLAMDNSSHFVGGGTAVENWLAKHAEAIDQALEAGLYRNEAMLNSAYFTEAFGQHFLTDAFSSGHIRVPREDIKNYYVNEFAPRIFNHLIDHLRNRLIDEIYDQIDDQTWVNEGAYLGGVLGGLGVRAYIRREIRNDINSRLNEAFDAAGGRAEAVRYVGLGLAGVISGAMHDMENREGLWVVNDFNAVPWVAYGDEHLDDSANLSHRQQIEEAVQASLADLHQAYNIGLEEGVHLYNVPEPAWVPDTVYFGFDLDALSPEAASSVDMVALYLNYHPSTRLTLVGHADPVGDNPYNEDLGSRRAHSVANRLMMLGVDPSRIEVESMGETVPVTTSRTEYHLNRRVEFVYSTDAAVVDDGPDSVALENIRLSAVNLIGPPYLAEGYLPRAAEGLNAALPAWHWGAIPETFQTEMANWVSHYVESYGEGALETDKLNDIPKDTPIGEFTISPRPIARRLLGEITADPIKFLESALGRRAG